MADTFVTCYRHADRQAGVSCQRCGRPICPSCMTAASVGFQCPECLKQGAKAAPVYSARSMPGFVPIVTYVMMGLCLLAYVAQVATLWKAQPGVAAGNAMTSAGSSDVGEFGILAGVALQDGEWWRLVTSGFLHSGLIHIGLNMYVLYILGPQLERLLGPVRFVGLYLGSLLAGSLGVIVLTRPNVGTLGASGAIFGLMGAMAAYQVAHKINIWTSGLGALIVLNLAFTFFGPNISVGGHLGGLVGGGALGFGLYWLEERRQPPVLGLVVALVFAGVCAATAMAIAPGGLVDLRL